jgi:hypothetical protein
MAEAWRVNPLAQDPATPEALRRVLPGVHRVVREESMILVESAGISLQSFGPIEARNGRGGVLWRKHQLRFPAQPKPAKRVVLAPLGVVGMLVNGMPLWNPTSSESYEGRNLWHRDAVRDASAMRITADSPRIVGYALDGYPIYNFTPGATSSYRLRNLRERTSLPDGTRLTPSQFGPPVNEEYPLGTFVEDYEFHQDHGTLDEHNGRYQDGNYGYYLSSYPYAVGPTLHGELLVHALGESQFRYEIQNAAGVPVRHLEHVHERPVHLILVSEELQEFHHVHPELRDDGAFHWTQRFSKPGTHHGFAQYTPPGKSEQLRHSTVEVAAHEVVKETRTELPFAIRLERPEELRTGIEYTFRFHMPVDNLEPYLGAWGHFIFVDTKLREFLHGHPVPNEGPIEGPLGHQHAVVGGPSPAVIELRMGFDQPGRYRLWAQFQHEGKELVFPYWLEVAGAETVAARSNDPQRISITRSGYEPAEFVAEKDKPVLLEFLRTTATGCGSRIVFPELGLQRELPLQEPTLISLPPMAAGIYRFTCGMGMYRGAVVIR